MTLRVIFMGTPDFAAAALQALMEGPHQVVAVYSQPPRPSGRGMKLTPSPTQQLAEAHGVPVFTPTSLKKPEAQEAFKNHQADIAVVAAYGLILPPAILEAPRLGCINIHGSILPRWRGAAPVQRAILAGDTETGITFMQMDAGLDTGPMLRVHRTPITAATTAPELFETLTRIGADGINDIVSDWAAGRITPTPQPTAGVTYAEKLRKDEGAVDGSLSVQDIHRRIRALNPWPGVWANLEGARVKLLSASLSPSADAMPMACADGVLYLNRLQPDGGKPMTGRAFQIGRHHAAV